MAGLIFKAPYYSPSSKTADGAGRGGYVSYIATREGVELLRGGMASYVNERQGSNGLFTDEGEMIIMSRIVDEVEHHEGNVWGLIFSLKREDAERLGYNSAEQWMNLLRSHRNDIASQMHIAPEHLRWYAAFHQKEKNPHAHMLVWSTRPREPYLSREGIHNIKKLMAADIFRQDLISVYKRQTELRDDLRAKYRARMKKIAEQIRQRSFDLPELEMKFVALAEKLKKTKGKKVYGYLDRHAKKIVDEIVRLLAEDADIAELYELWHQCRCEIFRTYTDAMPEKIPLEENDEFKPIRNAVVSLAADFTLPLDEALLDGADNVKPPKMNGGNYGDAYYYTGMKSLGEDSDEADYYLTKAVGYGHGRAAFMLSKLYKDGTLEPPDKGASKRFLYRAVELGDSVAEYVYGKELLAKDAEQGRQLLERSAKRGNAQAMYLLGKQLFDEGDTEEGLRLLEEAAKRDLWAQTQLGLLYFYKLGDRAKGAEHINHASRSGYAPAQAAVRQINRGRNAYIVAGIVNLFCHASRIIEDSTTRYDEGYGIDSRLRRELEQKKRGEMSMSM